MWFHRGDDESNEEQAGHTPLDKALSPAGNVQPLLSALVWPHGGEHLLLLQSCYCELYRGPTMKKKRTEVKGKMFQTNENAS